MQEPSAAGHRGSGEPGDIRARIGQRVRALRTERAMTLDGLASDCGVSRSMLSLIERGECSPTAVVLERVATGLGVSLATLFAAPGAAPRPVSRGAERSRWRDPQSGYTRCNISPPGFPSPLQIVEIVLPAGALVAYETGPRTPAVHQQVWVRAGVVEVTLGGAAYRLEADDCLAMELDEPTSFRNPTGRDARYIVVLTSDRPAGTPR